MRVRWAHPPPPALMSVPAPEYVLSEVGQWQCVAVTNSLRTRAARMYTFCTALIRHLLALLWGQLYQLSWPSVRAG